jgi:hypothetical protein
MSTREVRLNIKKRPLGVAEFIKWPRSGETKIWSDKIDKLLKYLEAENMEKTQDTLTNLKDEVVGYARGTSGAVWSERILAIQEYFRFYVNACECMR